jgi:hypothetical protein
MRRDYHYKTKKEIYMSSLTYNCIHNFNNDEKLSSWERRGAFKKRLAPCHKGMGPKLNFGIKNFHGELSKHFYIYIFLLQSILECKLTKISTT